MIFEKIIGNLEVKNKLKNAFDSDSLSNTILFIGPDGVGKFLFAKELALHLMYKTENIDLKILKKINENTHPDLHILKPEGKTYLHNIASIRNLISEVNMAPYEALAKVFVIEDADRMLPSSANALLKTLEEPTFDSYIILLASSIDNILPTIISRCFRFNFSGISEEEILKYLMENCSFSCEDAKILARISNNSIGKAIELSNHKEYIKKRDMIISILSKQNISNYFDLLEALGKLEDIYLKTIEEDENIKLFKEIDLLFEKIFYWFRDLYILKVNLNHKIFFQDKQDILLKQDLKNLPDLNNILKNIDEAKLAFQRNIRLKNILENFFLNINFINCNIQI